jgi:PEGA domain-containing protein
MYRKVFAFAFVFVLLGVQSIAQVGQSIVLDDGTPIRLRTTQTISSADAHTDDRVDFEVVDDVKVGDVVVIRHGTAAIGTVTEAQSKRRMGRGGKLAVNIDFTKTVSGEKVALRGVKDGKGGGHTGAMTGAMVGTAIVFWPAAPFFLFMQGKDISVPKGHEFNVYSSGAMTLNSASLEQGANGTLPAGGIATSIAVISNPTGAEIQIDGNFVGSTPTSVPVSHGNHVIRVHKPGYATWERTIQVTGGTVNVNAELSRAAHAQSSSMSAR